MLVYSTLLFIITTFTDGHFESVFDCQHVCFLFLLSFTANLIHELSFKYFGTVCLHLCNACSPNHGIQKHSNLWKPFLNWFSFPLMQFVSALFLPALIHIMTNFSKLSLALIFSYMLFTYQVRVHKCNKPPSDTDVKLNSIMHDSYGILFQYSYITGPPKDAVKNQPDN